MKLLGVTSTRADWGLLEPLFSALRAEDPFDLKVLVTGQHLSEPGNGLSVLAEDGFEADHIVDLGMTATGLGSSVGRTMGKALAGVSEVIASVRPDMMIVLGDRYEILAAASAALVSRVPVAHLCGGDLTLGAFDDACRHAITKMSSLHFPTNAEAAMRIVQMGEDPARVHCVGSTGLDRMRRVAVMDRSAFTEALSLAEAGPLLLVTVHPVTLAADPLRECKELILALERRPEARVLVTGSNADPGGAEIDAMMRAFVESRKNAVFRSSLGSRLYFSALRHSDAVIGNSSSGLYEAPSFGIPTVNVGDRQQGRPRAASVIDCSADATEILDAIDGALAMQCRDVRNPYGDGHSVSRIVAILRGISNPFSLTRKQFHEAAV